MEPNQTLGEEIADDISSAIDNAQEQAEQAAATAEQIAAAALEGERGNHIAELERRLNEWENSQSDTSQAIAALTLGLTELSGQVSTLSTLLAPPTPPPLNVGDGPRGNQEDHEPEETVVVVEAEAPEIPPPEQPAPRKKRHSWI